MFKKKKIVALCATTLVGISTFGSLAPMAVFADVSKNGETTVAYEGVPKPTEWGLSVPSQVNLDIKKNNYAFHNDKIEIVKSDGSAFEDDTKDHTFSVSGTSKYLNDINEPVLVNVNDNNKTTRLLFGTTSQGAADPGEGNLSITPGISTITDMKIVTKQDKSGSAPYIYLRSAIETTPADIAAGGNSLDDIISWTATEM